MPDQYRELAAECYRLASEVRPQKAGKPIQCQYALHYVAVDRQLKSGFGTYEAAEKAAKEIKKRYPNPHVTVFDAKSGSQTAIE